MANSGEAWALRIVQSELKQEVFHHDDNSQDGMYDLRIGEVNAPEIAIECVAAVDRIATETWNIGPAKGPLQLSLQGNWFVEIARTARVKVIKREAETLLKELEAREIYRANVDHWLRWHDDALFDRLESLGITWVSCYEQQGTGKVHLTMPGDGGAVDEQGHSIPTWVGTFLREPAQQDVISKLERSRAPGRHAFVIVTLGGASWAVDSYLTGSLDNLPPKAPDLPLPVTGVWVLSNMARRGIRWDGSTWRFFDV